MDTTSDNKSVIEDYYRRLNRRDLDGASALATEDLVNHAAIPQAQGRAGLRTIHGKLFDAFPDGQYRVEDLIAEGDRVVARVRVTGTHTGPFNMVRAQLEATGRAVDVEQIQVFRVASGRIVELWAGMDHLALQRQLGLVLKPG